MKKKENLFNQLFAIVKDRASTAKDGHFLGPVSELWTAAISLKIDTNSKEFLNAANKMSKFCAERRNTRALAHWPRATDNVRRYTKRMFLQDSK